MRARKTPTPGPTAPVVHDPDRRSARGRGRPPHISLLSPLLPPNVSSLLPPTSPPPQWTRAPIPCAGGLRGPPVDRMSDGGSAEGAGGEEWAQIQDPNITTAIWDFTVPLLLPPKAIERDPHLSGRPRPSPRNIRVGGGRTGGG